MSRAYLIVAMLATGLTSLGCQALGNSGAQVATSAGSRPIPLSPNDNISPLPNIKFSYYSAAPAGTEYLVECWSLSSQSEKLLLFAKRTTSTSFTLASSDLAAGAVLLPTRYYWRITALFRGDQIIGDTVSFDAIPGPFSMGGANVVYVDVNSASTYAYGGQTAPFRTIGSAIAGIEALRSGNTAMMASIYVAKGSYTETLSIPPGISIYGGYDPKTWQRNYSTNVTTINSTANPVVSFTGTGNFSQFSLLDGFTVLPPAPSSGAVQFVSCNNAAMQFRNNAISVLSGASSSVSGIGLSTCSNSVIQNVTLKMLLTSNNGAYYGISCSTSNALNISFNRISTAETSLVTVVHGLYLQACPNATIVNNQILVDNTMTSSNSTGITLDSISVTGSGNANISRNAIVTRSAGVSKGVEILTTSGGSPNLILDSNIISVQVVPTTNANYGMAEATGAASNPQAITNNIIVNPVASSGFSFYNRVPTGYNTLCSGNFGQGGCGTLLSSPAGVGNAGGANISPNNTIFTSTYIYNDITTWIWKPLGAADVNANGVYDTGIDRGPDPGQRIGP